MEEKEVPAAQKRGSDGRTDRQFPNTFGLISAIAISRESEGEQPLQQRPKNEFTMWVWPKNDDSNQSERPYVGCCCSLWRSRRGYIYGRFGEEEVRQKWKKAFKIRCRQKGSSGSGFLCLSPGGGCTKALAMIIARFPSHSLNPKCSLFIFNS